MPTYVYGYQNWSICALMKTCAQMTIKEVIFDGWENLKSREMAFYTGPEPHLTEAGGKRKELQLLG